MESTTSPNPITASLRPTFLTVLCILTFIGSGWGVYKGISGYFTADMTASIMADTRSKIDDQMEGKEQPAFMKNFMGNMFSSMSADNIRKSSIISLISCLFTLGGAIMMWTLRKTGYYLYIAGILLSVLGPLVVFKGGMMGIMAGGFTALIGILFVILYGANVKYMVK